MERQRVVRWLVGKLWFVCWLLLTPWLASTTTAQQVCGDGSTFQVNLPSVSGGPGDVITLPANCRVYALTPPVTVASDGAGQDASARPSTARATSPRRS